MFYVAFSFIKKYGDAEQSCKFCNSSPDRAFISVSIGTRSVKINQETWEL